MQPRNKNLALKLCITAMFSALLVGGKQALAALPNVEVVTLLIAVCAFVWGLPIVLPAVCAFILCDLAIWGLGTWVFSYLLHWNTVAIIFWLLSKLPLRRRWFLALFGTVAAVTLTVLFGVLTSAVDTVIGFTGKGFFADFSQFGPRFAALYLAGVPFFVTHIVANTVLFAVAFFPLVLLNLRARTKLFPPAPIS